MTDPWARRSRFSPNAERGPDTRSESDPESAPLAPASSPSDDEPAAPLRGDDEPVSYEADIKPLFREGDRRSMNFTFDLWSYDDVSSRAAGILERLEDGSMPCDGAWPEAQIQVFRRWIETGTRR